MAMPMAETVNIPLLPCWAMRGRRSDTAAGIRNAPLKAVGADARSEVRVQSREPRVRRPIRGYLRALVILLPRKSAKHNLQGTRTVNGHTWLCRAY